MSGKPVLLVSIFVVKLRSRDLIVLTPPYVSPLAVRVRD